MRDPASEIFDLCDAQGRPLGQTKPRGLVHRDGDWHRSFHCWVVSPSPAGPPRIVLQQRAFDKETSPGLWDVSVGGHYAAGEGIEGGIREMREELGLQVVVEDLLHVAWRREEVFYANGLIEREIQDIYFLWREIDLTTLRPDPVEVIAVALLPPKVLVDLASGRIGAFPSMAGHVTPQGAVEPAVVGLHPADLVPRAGNYYAHVARFALRLAAGQATVRRRWWSRSPTRPG
jgi:isopentenyldiphosphate isomerase